MTSEQNRLKRQLMRLVMDEVQDDFPSVSDYEIAEVLLALARIYDETVK